MTIRTDISDLMSEFRLARHQTIQKDTGKVPFTRGSDSKHKRDHSIDYSSFLTKYANLETYIDDFGTKDFVYLFKTIAEENKVKYVPSSLPRDMAVIKKARENYSNRELYLMIEFLFSSNQTYLRKDDIQPTILVSKWCNKIYHDSILWSEDKYLPNAKAKPKREWTDKTEDVKIGEWE